MTLHRTRINFLLMATLLSLLAGCATPIEPPAFRTASFADLPGWGEDNHASALAAFKVSCGRILKADPSKPFSPKTGQGGTMGDWQGACRLAAGVTDGDNAAARAFFENTFTPYAVTGRESGREEGLFTGYFEAALRGSRTRHGPYQTPLHSVSANLKKPTFTRAEIVAGALPDDIAIVIVDDKVAAFFLHIQGSGRVEMDDGTVVRVGFAERNGHEYYAIGKEFVKRGMMDKEQVSMQAIKKWLAENPDQADAMMNLNPSYIFFRELDLPSGAGPIGAEGVPLTPGRSLAVDREHFAYGVPVFTSFDAPSGGRDCRLMVCQDTGGAIKGAVRGDVFWGFGDDAAAKAGPMRAPARKWLLYPKHIAPQPLLKS